MKMPSSTNPFLCATIIRANYHGPNNHTHHLGLRQTYVITVKSISIQTHNPAGQNLNYTGRSSDLSAYRAFPVSQWQRIQ